MKTHRKSECPDCKGSEVRYCLGYGQCRNRNRSDWNCEDSNTPCQWSCPTCLDGFIYTPLTPLEQLAECVE